MPIEIKSHKRISNTIHLFYVFIFIFLINLYISVFLSIAWPYYLSSNTIDNYFGNVSPLWFIPSGFFFSICIAPVVHRLVKVHLLKSPSSSIPVSRIIEIGKSLIGWRGFIALMGILIIYILAGQIRQYYYSSYRGGMVPGLIQSRDKKIRLWTTWAIVGKKRYKNQFVWKNYINTLKNDLDSEVRANAAFWLGKTDDPRKINILLMVLEEDNSSDVQRMAKWALKLNGVYK